MLWRGADVAVLRAYARPLRVRRGALEHAVNARVPFFGDGFGRNFSGVVLAQGDHYVLEEIEAHPRLNPLENFLGVLALRWCHLPTSAHHLVAHDRYI